MTVDATATGGIDLGGASLLLIAPHPDDESLACGGLIQHAVRAGARITLLQVTDGDNNPWPQRWLERRWRIGVRERQRWAARRVGEVAEALRCLGLPHDAWQRLAWPDLGVGERLLDDGVRAIDTFAGVIRAAAPDIVVLPDLHDRHPDHGASHVLGRLALAQLSRRPTCLTYLVHGHAGRADSSCTIMLDSDMQEAKRSAILAHHTQVALARRRLLAMAGREEPLYRLQPAEYARAKVTAATVSLPWRPPSYLAPWLQLSVAHPGGSHVWSWQRAPVQRVGRDWRLKLPDDVRGCPVFARLQVRATSPWIFDHWGWRDLTTAPSTGQADE